MVRGQPARLGEARRELEMMSGNRAAQFAGHPYAVANACAAAENAFVARDLADERHADEEPLRVGHRLAADQRHAVPLGQGGHAVVNRLDTFGGEAVRQTKRDRGPARRAGHRGNVAQRAAKGLMANLLRISVFLKMNALDHGVGLV